MLVEVAGGLAVATVGRSSQRVNGRQRNSVAILLSVSGDQPDALRGVGGNRNRNEVSELGHFEMEIEMKNRN